MLSEEQKQQLCEWLLTPALAYRVIKQMVAEEFQLEVSMSWLSLFYKQHCVAELVRRRAQAVLVTNQIGEEMERTPGNWDQPTLDAIKQKSFEMAISPGSKPADIKQLFSMVLKSRDQDMNERKLRMLEAAERKANEAEATTKDSSLSPEEKQQRMKEIFGLA